MYADVERQKKVSDSMKGRYVSPEREETTGALTKDEVVKIVSDRI